MVLGGQLYVSQILRGSVLMVYWLSSILHAASETLEKKCPTSGSGCGGEVFLGLPTLAQSETQFELMTSGKAGARKLEQV